VEASAVAREAAVAFDALGGVIRGAGCVQWKLKSWFQWE